MEYFSYVCKFVVIESTGMCGFTRALVVRLVLSAERVSVGVEWAGAGVGATVGVGAESGAGEQLAPPHPALYNHRLLSLPATTTIRALLADHRPPSK